jgi:hypothetical protein
LKRGISLWSGDEKSRNRKSILDTSEAYEEWKSLEGYGICSQIQQSTGGIEFRKERETMGISKYKTPYNWVCQ